MAEKYRLQHDGKIKQFLCKAFKDIWTWYEHCTDVDKRQKVKINTKITRTLTIK
jgi:hypothetical protein